MRLRTALEQRADAILALLWPVMRSDVAGRRTLKGWRSANRTPANELAELGKTDAEILAAHAFAKSKMREAPYTLWPIVRALPSIGEHVGVTAISRGDFASSVDLFDLEPEHYAKELSRAK